MRSHEAGLFFEFGKVTPAELVPTHRIVVNHFRKLALGAASFNHASISREDYFMLRGH
jgi:hypothetical protein